jgi:transposase
VEGWRLADDAANACRRRTFVCRLCREDDCDHRSSDWRIATSAGVCRRPGASNHTYAEARWTQGLADWIGCHVTLAELNAVISELIDELNNRTMRRIGCCRRALFEAIERSALKPLPSEPFEYAEWKRCRAGLDYHVEVRGHWYSVPFRLIREALEARITDRTVEIFHRGPGGWVRVAAHARNPLTTVPDHMPSAHRRCADWTLGRLAARPPGSARHLWSG